MITLGRLHGGNFFSRCSGGWTSKVKVWLFCFFSEASRLSLQTATSQPGVHMVIRASMYLMSFSVCSNLLFLEDSSLNWMEQGPSQPISNLIPPEKAVS